MAEDIGTFLTLAQLHDDPYPHFQRLLAEAPVAWMPELRVWLVTRYEDVVRVLTDPATFRLETDHSLIADTLGPMMLSMDGAAHQRLRSPFSAPFRPRRLRERYTRTVADLAQEIIDGFVDRGRGDLDRLFADRLALRSVTTVLGFPLEAYDYELFRSWYDDFAAAIANFTRDPAIRERGRHAFAQFRAAVLELLARLRHHPNESVLSSLLHGRRHDLTDDELVANTAITFFGGLETTAGMLSNTIWALLRHPEQLERLRRRPSGWPLAIEEALRWEAPVQTAHRQVARPAILNGVGLRPGETVQCMIGAANRDPRLFPEPDVFDIGRKNAGRHLSFAIGPHYCFGAPLARLEATIGLPILFERLPGLRLDPGGEGRPVGYEFRSPPALDVLWDSSAAAAAA